MVPVGVSRPLGRSKARKNRTSLLARQSKNDMSAKPTALLPVEQRLAQQRKETAEFLGRKQGQSLVSPGEVPPPIQLTVGCVFFSCEMNACVWMPSAQVECVHSSMKHSTRMMHLARYGVWDLACCSLAVMSPP